MLLVLVFSDVFRSTQIKRTIGFTNLTFYVLTIDFQMRRRKKIVKLNFYLTKNIGSVLVDALEAYFIACAPA